MSLRIEDANPFIGLWRSSAMEKMPYTDDFPEALLVTPEFWDGAVGQGNATHITTTFTVLPSGSWKISVTDNGVGITNERRLKTWAASKSKDLLHQNGHGTKKAITKYAREYETATWSIKWRNPKKNLQVMTGPFFGTETHVQEVEDDSTTLYPSGTLIEVEFEPSVLGRFKSSSQDLANAIRELITTRYSEDILQRIEFTVEINPPLPQKPVTLNSRRERWHSFQWHVDDWAKKAKSEDIAHICHHSEEIDGGHWTLDAYLIGINGNCSYELRAANRFPFYGKKDMNRARAHISLNGRMIEAVYIHRLMGSDNPHNRFNGMLWFINFVPNTTDDFLKMPKPSTTKVSFYEEDDVMKKFQSTVKEKYELGLAKFEEAKRDADRKEQEKKRAERDALAKANEERRKIEEESREKAVKKTPKKKTPLLKAPAPAPAPATIHKAPSQADILSEFCDMIAEVNSEELLEYVAAVDSEPNDTLMPVLNAVRLVKEHLTLMGVLQAT